MNAARGAEAPGDPLRRVHSLPDRWRPGERDVVMRDVRRAQADGLFAARPQTRADCRDGPRPCPWASCRHHLGLDVTEAGSLVVRAAPLSETCSLDVADRGGLTLDEVGRVLGLTRERVRQIEVKASVALRGLGVLPCEA